MWKGTNLLARMAIMVLLALGLLGFSTAAAQSAEICSPNPALALADGNGDGVVSVGELQALNELAGGNADLEAQIDRVVAQGITGIRYTGCTADGDAGGGDTSTDSDATSSGGSSDTGVNGDGAVTGTPGAPGQAATSTTSGSTTATSGNGAESSASFIVTRLPAVGDGDNTAAHEDILGGNFILAGMSSLLLIGAGIVVKRARRT